MDCGLTYFAAREIDGRVEPDRRESALVISPQALIEAGNLPGSPIVVVTRGEWQAACDNAMSEEIDRERLVEELEEANAALAEYEHRFSLMTDPEALAASVAERLSEIFARKTGPKPKESA